MTEVPEHLLQRSRARRAALGLGGDAGAAPAVPAAAAAPAAEAAPVAAAAPAPAAAPAAPPKPKPVAPYVQAAQRRQKIPFWVAPILAALPVWGIMYATTLDKPSPRTAGPITEGATVYGSCSSCHGATGGGQGAFPKLSGGAVLETFESAADQLHWIMLGTAGYQELGLTTYGSAKKPVGGSGAVMPGWKDLSAEQLIAVVRHERETLSGEKLDAAGLKAEYEEMLAMVKKDFPDRYDEFSATIEEWKDLDPSA